METLPSDILLKITEYLSHEDYFSLGMVSWRLLHVLEYGHSDNKTRNLRILRKCQLNKELELVKNYGENIEHVSNPSISVQLAAVRESGRAIKYIKNPPLAVQMAAVTQNPVALYLIGTPYDGVAEKAKSIAKRKGWNFFGK